MNAAAPPGAAKDAKSLPAEAERARRKIALGAALGIARSRADMLLHGQYGPLSPSQQAALHEIVTQLAHADSLRLEEERTGIGRRPGLAAAITERRGDRPQPPTLAGAMSPRSARHRGR